MELVKENNLDLKTTTWTFGEHSWLPRKMNPM